MPIGLEWPDDKPFLLTPEEAYWIMRGLMVLPASKPDADILREMPGALEMIGGYIKMQS